MSESEITFEKTGRCGVITLNRPRALNALSLDMIVAMGGALDSFARDAEIRSVVVRSTSPTAFCAGADIKHVARLGEAGQHAEQLAFLAKEYHNCHRIRFYPKPYVALIDAIIMGGGAGIAVNGGYRVVGERVSFAMPEVGIGFFPDVGASYFLSRLPAKIGVYLAVTGARAGLGDVVRLGLANAHVPAARFDALLERLAAGEDAERAIAAEKIAPPASDLLSEREMIAQAFAAASLAAILAEVEAQSAGSAFAAATLKVLRSRSPTSMAIALQQMQLGANLDFDAALRMEFRIASRIVYGHDFYEGVRAALVDKNHAPRWKPASVEAIDAADVTAHFAPLSEDLSAGAA
ncbi:MAG: enoyl-CoA hydratase/isomerase family protein [Methylovirgula sp.]